MRKLFKNNKSRSNLTKPHRAALNYLRSQRDFIVAHCDKNLGPAIIERDKYISYAFCNHSNNTTTYKQLLP